LLNTDESHLSYLNEVQMETIVQKYNSPITLSPVNSKYYGTFRHRISAKIGHLERPESDNKLVARLQAELKSLSFKFRSVFDNSHSYFIILDTEMNILDFNRASLRLIKKLFGKKMIVGDNILNFIHPSSVKIITESCERAFTGKKFKIEKMISYQDDCNTWWSFEFSPAYNLRGNITGLVFNANDITKRKEYEEKIRRQHQKLEEISVMQSHEIRGPVSTIMALMSLIKEDKYDTGKEYLMLLETTANMLDQNIREIVERANDE